MWYYSEATTPPQQIDDTSSKKYVYVTKDAEEFEREIDGETVTMYRWQEQKIAKADWELYQSVMKNTGDISDANDALIELAELISEIMEG